jgi:hypothetical protein
LRLWLWIFKFHKVTELFKVLSNYTLLREDQTSVSYSVIWEDW